MGRKFKKDDNFLEFIPKKNTDIDWEEDRDCFIKLVVKRDNLLDKLVRVFVKTPMTMKVELEEIGSFIWKNIDGKKSVMDIGESLLCEFGDEIEPVYERLSTYINILRNNKFITLEKM